MDPRRFRHFRFPERAGALQAAADARGLVDELGANYDRYHEVLADALERFGSRSPDPADYAGRWEDYARDCDYLMELLVAEQLLRDCAVARGDRVQRRGRLVDERGRLVSGRTGGVSCDTRKGCDPAGRKPPRAHPSIPL
jgi:hypothetical protein